MIQLVCTSLFLSKLPVVPLVNHFAPSTLITGRTLQTFPPLTNQLHLFACFSPSLYLSTGRFPSRVVGLATRVFLGYCTNKYLRALCFQTPCGPLRPPIVRSFCSSLPFRFSFLSLRSLQVETRRQKQNKPRLRPSIPSSENFHNALRCVRACPPLRTTAGLLDDNMRRQRHEAAPITTHPANFCCN